MRTETLLDCMKWFLGATVYFMFWSLKNEEIYENFRNHMVLTLDVEERVSTLGEKF